LDLDLAAVGQGATTVQLAEGLATLDQPRRSVPLRRIVHPDAGFAGAPEQLPEAGERRIGSRLDDAIDTVRILLPVHPAVDLPMNGELGLAGLDHLAQPRADLRELRGARRMVTGAPLGAPRQGARGNHEAARDEPPQPEPAGMRVRGELGDVIGGPGVEHGQADERADGEQCKHHEYDGSQGEGLSGVSWPGFADTGWRACSVHTAVILPDLG